MSYLDLATTLVKNFEGCRLTGYPDTGGVPTNGYGHTGPEVKIGVAISQEIADHNLAVDLATADHRLVTATGGAPPLSDHQRATLIDFVFNLGANPDWTIWRDLRAGKLDDVPAQLMRFDHGKEHGKLVVIPGLEHRRAAECVFWRTADVAQATAVIASAPVPQPSSGYTRAIETPPTPLPQPPLDKASMTTKIVTAVSGVAAGAGTLGSQVHGIVAPHADESHIFAMLATGATGVVIAASIVALLIHGQQHAARAV